MTDKYLKHAYLIMIHENSEVLHKCLQMIDDERNDIFIHIDRKSKNINIDTIKNCIFKSSLFFSTRTKVFWGNISLVEAEYKLFEMAYQKRLYRYYHLLSGADMPIKSQDYIHQFFQKFDGKLFIGYSDKYFYGNVECIHPFPSQFRNNGGGKQLLSDIIVKLQKVFHFSIALNKKIEFKRGAQWVSVTDDFVNCLLSQKDYWLQRFKYSYCLDECYKQTIAWNSPFKEYLYNINDEFTGCMRLIDWNRGKPYSFKVKDFEEIINSDRLFCRKINDVKLAQKIYDYIHRQHI